jgi:rod shape-determining protein MreB and related proteins
MSTAGLSLPMVWNRELPFSQRLLNALCPNDLAMDLGTANTLIYMKNYGVVLNEPSVVAVEDGTRKVLAVGTAAKKMFGKTSAAIRCVRPIKDGVIADFDMTTTMIQYMLSQVRRGWSLFKPRIIIGVPSEITQVEKRAVIDATLTAATREVVLVEEPMAAALGMGLPIDKPVGNMIVDIGGGTTDVAIISMNGTIYSQSVRVAGDEMDEAIQRQIRRSLSLQVGIFEAERIKLVIGSASPLGKTHTTSVCGRDVASGCPRQIELTDDLVREALNEPIAAIISSVAAALEQTSPEIAHDIVGRGIHLAGGGALLRGLSDRLQRETGIPFHRALDPLCCVVRGVGQILEDLKDLRVLCIA